MSKRARRRRNPTPAADAATATTASASSWRAAAGGEAAARAVAGDDAATIEQLWPPIPDWARESQEEPQTVADFEALERWRPTARRKKLYLLQMGALPDSPGAPTMEQLRDFATAYLCLETHILPQRLEVSAVLDDDSANADEDSEESTAATGKRHRRQRKPAATAAAAAAAAAAEQLQFVDSEQGIAFPVATCRSKDYPGLLRAQCIDVVRILKDYLPRDGLCVLGVTMVDLYEHRPAARDRHDEPLMGRGTGDRVGILSLLRFDPLLARRLAALPLAYSPAMGDAWLQRTVKTMAHECLHMVGIDHCVTSADDDDAAEPFHLCPVDLIKLGMCTGCRHRQRYANLEAWFRAQGFATAAEWAQKAAAALAPEP